MKNLAILSIVFLVSACSPTMNYLGDTYPPTDEIDVYYDEGDIKHDYRVIGQLSGDNINNPINDLEKVKKKMIEEGKLRGANGILFLFSDSYDNEHIIKSKLLRYNN